MPSALPPALNVLCKADGAGQSSLCPLRHHVPMTGRWGGRVRDAKGPYHRGSSPSSCSAVAPQPPAAHNSGAMGFGPELWCPQGHSALLRLQDNELRLLELMKKWMSQRAKSDREYAGMLHHMFSQLEKQECPGQLRAGDQGSQIGEVGMRCQPRGSAGGWPSLMPCPRSPGGCWQARPRC